MYEEGRGVPQSWEDAFEWYWLAAEQGDIYAQWKMGWMHERGIGAMQSYEMAAYWYRKAAEEGHALAQCCLGQLYDNGRGVPQSDSKAIMWYRMASEQDVDEALYHLGVMYEEGRGVQQSEYDAVQYYKVAANLGNADAQSCLERLFNDVEDVLQTDVDVLLTILDAEHGGPDSQLILGNMYKDGKGVRQSYAKASEWYKNIADQGNSVAQYALGLIIGLLWFESFFQTLMADFYIETLGEELSDPLKQKEPEHNDFSA